MWAFHVVGCKTSINKVIEVSYDMEKKEKIAAHLLERMASCCLPLRRVCSAADTVCDGPVAFSISVSRRLNASFSRACRCCLQQGQGGAMPLHKHVFVAL